MKELCHKRLTMFQSVLRSVSSSGWFTPIRKTHYCQLIASRWTVKVSWDAGLLFRISNVASWLTRCLPQLHIFFIFELNWQWKHF